MSFEAILRLLHAVEHSDVDVVSSLLDSDPHMVILTDTDGVSALHVASYYGHVELVKYLLQRGANVNTASTDGSTPLTEASAGGWVDIAKILVNHGAKVNPPLLLSSPLHEAALRGHTECCQFLISQGAQLNCSDCNFGTPLHAAAHKTNIPTAKVLLDAGADVNARKIHSTPLHVAVESRNQDMILLLLTYGANVYLTDNHNRKPSDLLPLYDHLRSLLIDFEVMPRSLMDLCRLSLKKRFKLSELQQVHLPDIIREFVCFRDVFSDGRQS